MALKLGSGGAGAPMSPLFRTFISGIGFMSDAYDLFVINLAKSVLFAVYPLAASSASNKSLQTSIAASITTAALVGAIFGQLIFGFMADRLGRRAVFVVTISLVILGALGSASCVPSALASGDEYAAHATVFYQLVFWRSLLGFGVGGEYPLSATITSESNDTRSRGRSVAAVFSMQGVGNLLASVVLVVALRSGLALDVVWRVALGFGAVPGLLTVYWRYQMEESHYFKNVQSGGAAARGAEGAGGGAPRASGSVGSESVDSARLLMDGVGLDDGEGAAAAGGAGSGGGSSLARTFATIYEFRWSLLGTAGSWLIFDVVFYGNGLFSSNVLSGIGYGSGSLEDLADGNAIIALIGLPGYVVALLTIDRIGRRNIQLLGFAMVGLVFLAMAAFLDPLQKRFSGLFIFLYGLTFFFANFGPNMSTFVIPAEAFPTRAKATCHGISAASGKVGAAIGSSVFPIILAAFPTNSEGVGAVLYVCAGLSLLGLLWTLAFTKDTGAIDIAALDAHHEARLDRGEAEAAASAKGGFALN